DYPKPLEPVHDPPPFTVVTHLRQADAKLMVRGSTTGSSAIKRVLGNGQEARTLADNFAEGEVTLENPGLLEGKMAAHAEDADGNVEQTPHVMTFSPST